MSNDTKAFLASFGLLFAMFVIVFLFKVFLESLPVQEIFRNA